MVPDDFVDMTTDRDRYGLVAGGHLLIMRDPVCVSGREALVSAARRHAAGASPVHARHLRGHGGTALQSPAEVRHLQTLGDVVGQSFCPEVWLARDIDACYAGIYLIVNYGEGVVQEWEHDVLAQIFREDAGLMGRVLLDALAALPPGSDCHCRELRKPTLLTELARRFARGSPAAGAQGRHVNAQASTAMVLKSACMVMQVQIDPVRL